MKKCFITAFITGVSALLLLACLTGCTAFQTSLDNIDVYTGAGGTLNLWDPGPLTLDPAISSEMSSHIYVMQVFSGLVKFNAELKPVPDLAERWEVSPDGKTYTFYLRKNVKFHDGRKFTSADIRYSLERAMDPSTGSQTASTYLCDITGADGVMSGKLKSLSGVNVIDDYTVAITIDAPKTYFLSKMAYPTAFVVDRNNTGRGGEWWHKPNGTGPYKLTKFSEGELITLEPNQYYYGEKATARVIFHILSGMPMSLYETGKIDEVEITRMNVDRAMDELGPFHDQLHISPEFSLQYIGFNTGKPPFDDPYVRQAFCQAVDKDRIVKILQKDMVEPARGIIPAGMPGYDKDLKGLVFDPANARSLLAKSKYSGGLPPITITVAGWGGVDVDEFIGALIQDWKKNLGAEVSVRLLDPNAFHYNLKDEADEMFALGWIADYPDPQNFLETLFKTGSEYNYCQFSDQQFDKLLDTAATEQDSEKRMQLYRQAELIAVDKAPALPLWFGKNYYLVNPRVHNFNIDALGVPRLNLVTIEK